MHSSQLPNKGSKYMPKNLHHHLISLKCHNFYIGSTIRPLHIRIKEHLNTRAFSFHKYLIKCKKKKGQLKSHLLCIAFKHPKWYHGHNTQHRVLTLHVTLCLQCSKKNLNIQHRVHFKKVSDDEVFTLKLIRLK